MQRVTTKAMGASVPKAVPSPGAVSAVGPTGAAPKPRIKNTRDYGKADPMPASPAANPFGPTQGGSRLGGI